MGLLDWNPDWEMGIPMVDHQHRELFNRFEILLEAVHTEATLEQVRPLLFYLTEYVDLHFSAEEALMEEQNYPGRWGHLFLHDELRHRIDSLHSQVKDSPEPAVQKTIDLLIDWLIYHIDVEDRKFALHCRRFAS